MPALTNHARTDHARTDYARTDYAHTDHVRTDHAHTDHVRTDYVRTDYARTDHARTDHAHTDHVRTDHARTDYARTGPRESSQFLQYVTDKLQFSKLPAEVPVMFRVVELPQNHHMCKVKSLNKGDANSEVTVYYQSGPKALREHTLMELLVMHMEEPCFDFLRTKETLGYHVYPTCRNTSGVLGFSVTVETQATKFNSEFVESKIEEFLASFGEKLDALTEEAFSTQVTALVKLKECEDTHLGEEVDRNWAEVLTQQYVFDRLQREITALKQMTKAELVSWFQEHRGPSSRKLSVHVVGFGASEQDAEGGAERGKGDRDEEEDDESGSTYGEVSRLCYLPPSARTPSANAIMDIHAFTKDLPLFPYHKILE
uniref:Coenzyme PQQ synthesis protein F-like C-terminal lobe domain-containing protein n=2 Tax=Knipowitschia caucasica TaxID=637954 RepID=A0AAV2JKT3_KNICA